jgi:hypothetical protein
MLSANAAAGIISKAQTATAEYCIFVCMVHVSNFIYKELPSLFINMLTGVYLQNNTH